MRIQRVINDVVLHAENIFYIFALTQQEAKRRREQERLEREIAAKEAADKRAAQEAIKEKERIKKELEAAKIKEAERLEQRRRDAERAEADKKAKEEAVKKQLADKLAAEKKEKEKEETEKKVKEDPNYYTKIIKSLVKYDNNVYLSATIDPIAGVPVSIFKIVDNANTYYGILKITSVVPGTSVSYEYKIGNTYAQLAILK